MGLLGYCSPTIARVVGLPRLARVFGCLRQMSGSPVLVLPAGPINRRRQSVLRGRASWSHVGGLSRARSACPGVVAAYGWSLSRLVDAHRRGLWRGEAVPRVPRYLPISGWPLWGFWRMCVAVCRRISAAVPLWFPEGTPVGMVPFYCR